ncbi:MAG: hypothetical protein L3J91_05850 [Thermoplasmata archaeon]|nr:hypothetical protein [Thermoplasmata archaeon]
MHRFSAARAKVDADSMPNDAAQALKQVYLYTSGLKFFRMEPTDGSAATAPSEPDVHELAARINLRLAQLGWPVLAEVETETHGTERLAVHPSSASEASAGPTPTFRVGPALLSRPNLVDAIVAEVRSRGWNRGGIRSAPRADVLWCTPA